MTKYTKLTKSELVEGIEDHPKLAKYFNLSKERVFAIKTLDFEGNTTEHINEMSLLTEECERIQWFSNSLEFLEDNNFGIDNIEKPFIIYLEVMGSAEYAIDHFEEDYCGEWDTELEYAEVLIEDCYDLEKIMGELHRYFDYEKFTRDLFINDYLFYDGFVFNNS